MGWTYPYHTEKKSDLINQIMRDLTWENEKFKTYPVKKCVRGNVLWVLAESKSKLDDTSEKFILCYVMEKYNTWGYKDMDESMHPYYYSCPLSYLELAPEKNREWRNGVRSHHGYLEQARLLRKRARTPLQYKE